MCDHHALVLAMNLAAISGHRRRKTNAAIRAAITRQCPSCLALTKETP